MGIYGNKTVSSYIGGKSLGMYVNKHVSNHIWWNPPGYKEDEIVNNFA